MRAWMESPPHRRIILTGCFREAGVGVAASLPAMLERGADGATYSLDLTALAPRAPSASGPLAARRAVPPSASPRAGRSVSTLTRTVQEVEGR